MAVRFLFGRAGSGKTHRCLEEVREQLLADPVAGPALVLFIPEQATVQTERMLLAADPRLAGATRYHTMSFRRLQQVVLTQTGFADREVVGPVGRQMILQYLLIRNRKYLKVLEKVASRPGTAAKVAAGLVEFMQEGLLSTHLHEMAAMVERAGEDAAAGSVPVPRDLLAGKLHDLALLYKEYTQWLTASNQADPATLLTETAERLDRCPWLTGAHVWVDGFASFSQQQRYALVQLAKVARRMTIALLLDPRIARDEQPPAPHDLFFRTWQTHQQLRQELLDAGLEIEEPVLLEGQPSRFCGRSQLARIEAQLFAPASPHEQPSKPAAAKAVEIEIVSAPDRQAEVEAVARKIIDLTRLAGKDGLRYRQIAVLVRDLGPYHDLFEAVFAAHGIPYFIDKRRGVSHHPLVELIRALLRLLTEDWPIDAVAALAKTGLAPIPRDRADLLENYLLAHGIAGWNTWCKGDWTYLRRMVGADEAPLPPSPREQAMLRKANYARRILCSILTDWSSPATARPQTGRDWADRLYRTLERLKVPQRLSRWQRLAAMRGGPAGLEQGQQHLRVWTLLVELLDDLVAGLGEVTLSVEEFQATIEAGLEAFSLPLIPPVVDQVVVGSVDRSRQPDITAAFLLGFNEGLFPLRCGPDVLLCDHERRWLGDLDGRLGLLTSQQRLFDERLLVYIALTRASRYVWLSYAEADETGKQLLPSPCLRAIQAVLPEVQVRALGDPLAELAIEGVGTAWQAARGVVLAGQEACNGQNAARPAGWIEDWAALHRWMRQDLALQRQIERVVSACDYGNTCTVRLQQAAALFGDRLECSVSQLQEYATCPYRYFARYGLRLKERPEFELAAVELGSFYHRILYKLAMKVRQKGHSLRSVPQEVLSQLVTQTADEEMGQVVEELAVAGGREEYLLQRARADIGSAMRGHVNLWRNSGFNPAALEAVFGASEGLPSLSIDTPKGRSATLRGKIDRIDVAAVAGQSVLAVIDYKRSSKYKLRLGDAFAGLQVQLIAYMKATMEAAAAGKIADAQAPVPGGMYYFNILPEWQKVDPGELMDPAKDQSAKLWRLQGFTNIDCLPAFGDGQDGHDWPVDVRLKKDGEPYANCPAGHTDELRKLIDHVWRSLGETIDRIFDGDFAIQPYQAGNRMPCPYCPYDPLCRFSPRFNRCRPIPRIGDFRKILEGPAA